MDRALITLVEGVDRGMWRGGGVKEDGERVRWRRRLIKRVKMALLGEAKACPEIERLVELAHPGLALGDERMRSGMTS